MRSRVYGLRPIPFTAHFGKDLTSGKKGIFQRCTAFNAHTTIVVVVTCVNLLLKVRILPSRFHSYPFCLGKNKNCVCRVSQL